mgnify:CR=1 FL=1
MGTDSNEMFHISTARSALPIINISHDADFNLSAEFSRRIILNKSFSKKLIKCILGLIKHIGSHFREKYTVNLKQNIYFCCCLLVTVSVDLGVFRLTASPSFGKADSLGVAARWR